MSKELKGKFTLLIPVDDRPVTIEVEDVNSHTAFLEVSIPRDEFLKAMARMVNVECSFQLRRADLVGKKQTHKMFEFPLPDCTTYENRTDISRKTSLSLCPKGWEPDNYFQSRDSFFVKEEDGKKVQYARTVIRNYADE